MTPARAATLILLVLIPAALWGYINTLRSDLATRTRAVLRQAQHGSEESRARLFARYRDPDASPDQQKKRYDRLWLTLSDLRPISVEYGSGEPRATSGCRARDHRQVIVQDMSRGGKPLTVRLEWVRCETGWCIADYSTSF